MLTIEGRDGKYHTRYLPQGIDRDDLADILDAAGLPDPEVTT